jgi:dienelactone hydrolase
MYQMGNGAPGGAGSQNSFGGTGGAGPQNSFGGTGGIVDPGGTGGTVDPGGSGGAVDPGGSARGPDPSGDSIRRNGPYPVESYTSGYRDGPQFADATVWYPVGAPEPLALVSVVPGYVSAQSSISGWGPFLASHGIATITIGTNSGGDQPPARALALMDSLESLSAESNRAGSPLQGKLDDSRMAVMGWSMGGGGTLIALRDNAHLKAGIGLAAWSPGANFSGVTQPSLLFAGTSDGLAGGQSQGFYSSIPASVPKMLFEVQGGPHEVANSPDRYSGEIGAYGLSWMKLFLEGDERYRKFLLEMPNVSLADFERNGL